MNDTILENDFVVEVKDDLPHPCQGKNHTSGRYGHDPDQPATWCALLGCGSIVELCDAWVQFTLKSVWLVHCQMCGGSHKSEDIVFIPLKEGRF